MKRRFKIPLVHWAWTKGYMRGLGLKQDAVDVLSADTYVLQVPPDVRDEDFCVEVVRSQWRKVCPNMVYRFVWEGAFFPGFRSRHHVSDPVRSIRLSLCKPGMEVCFQRPVLREQVVWTTGGPINHIITEWNPHEDEVMIACRKKPVATFVRRGVPNCPKCIAHSEHVVWVRYIVEPYEDPRPKEKAAHKAKAKMRVHSRYRTHYDRLNQDWLDE